MTTNPARLKMLDVALGDHLRQELALPLVKARRDRKRGGESRAAWQVGSSDGNCAPLSTPPRRLSRTD
jgi:hypothetical protein